MLFGAKGAPRGQTKRKNSLARMLESDDVKSNAN